MIKFQKVENNQIKELADLASSIWHEYWTCLLSPEQIDYMVENFQSENAIKEQIENENYTYYFIKYNKSLSNGRGLNFNANNMSIRNSGEGVVTDNENAGYFGISDKGDYLFLSKLYIKKEYRHKGIGGQAFEEIKKLTNGKPVRLTVNKHNTNSINAYKKWGFKTIDAVVTDIGSGFVMDDYIMEG